MITVGKTYGVYPGGEASVGINKAIQNALKSGIKTVKIPRGYYYLDAPILIDNGTFSKINLVGESSFFDYPGGTVLEMRYKSGYGIGVQWGKGVTIDGISIKGQFNPDVANFYHKTFEEYTDPTITEDWLNPYCGISIDPINRGTNTGSTGVTIRNCRIFNTSVGIANSPNGTSRNAEMTLIERCQFGYNRLAVSGSHDQERNNVIRDCFAWDYVHTFFSSHRYGVGIGGNWNIENCNLAGWVNTFIEWVGTGRHQMTVSKMNCERLGRFGRMAGFSRVENSGFDFVEPSELYATWHVEAMHGVEFHNCKLRHYGEFIPVNLKGDAKYFNCDFEAVPNYGVAPYYSGGGMKPKLINCYVNLKTYEQKETEYKSLGKRDVSQFIDEEDGLVLWEDLNPPYGTYNAGILDGGYIKYNKINGEHYLMAVAV